MILVNINDFKMSRSTKKYFLIESKGYSYCVPNRDLNTPDPAQVVIDQAVSFNYGTLKLEGVVIKISSKLSPYLFHFVYKFRLQAHLLQEPIL